MELSPPARSTAPAPATATEPVADLLGVDKSQLSRWLSGGENVQLHRIYATKLHGPFAIEQARDASGCVVETTVTYRAVGE